LIVSYAMGVSSWWFFVISDRHSGARVKRANPESRDSPVRNCAPEVHAKARAPE
jgi:hypothetical protein